MNLFGCKLLNHFFDLASFWVSIRVIVSHGCFMILLAMARSICQQYRIFGFGLPLKGKTRFKTACHIFGCVATPFGSQLWEKLLASNNVVCKIEDFNLSILGRTEIAIAYDGNSHLQAAKELLAQAVDDGPDFILASSDPRWHGACAVDNKHDV